MKSSRIVTTIQDGDGDPRHGTVNGYTNLRCRCADCREAWAVACYRRQQRRQLTDPDDPRHGTENGYGNYRCRCRPCTDAWSAGTTARANRRKERLRREAA